MKQFIIGFLIGISLGHIIIETAAEKIIENLLEENTRLTETNQTINEKNQDLNNRCVFKEIR